jgi:hypothetical protein
MSIMLASPCLSHWWEKVGPREAENDVSIMHGVVLSGKLIGHVNECTLTVKTEYKHNILKFKKQCKEIGCTKNETINYI